MRLKGHHACGSSGGHGSKNYGLEEVWEAIEEDFWLA